MTVAKFESSSTSEALLATSARGASSDESITPRPTLTDGQSVSDPPHALEPARGPNSDPTRLSSETSSTQLLAAKREEHKKSLHIGPLPDPRTLAEYNRAIPGLAERIVAAFETEGKHRRGCDVFEQQQYAKQVDAAIGNSKRGMLFAFVIAMSTLGIAGFLIHGGHDVGGGLLAAGDLGALCAVFVVQGRRKKVAASEKSGVKAELKQKNSEKTDD